MKDKKTFIISLAILMILLIIGGVSFAFYTALLTKTNEDKNIVITAGSLVLEYNGNISTVGEIKRPGDYLNSTFTVKNIGINEVNSYDIIFVDVINNVSNNEYVYELTCTSYANYGAGNQQISGTCVGKNETPVPTTGGIAITSETIPINITHVYNLKVTFKEIGVPQDYNQGKVVQFKLNIE